MPAAGTYTVRLVNDGAIAHDVTFADGTKIAAEAGQTAEGSVDHPGRRHDVQLLRARARGRRA